MTTEPTPTPAPVGAAPQTPNPLAGIPVPDLIRDGAALLLLLISFALPWNITSSGIEKSSGHIVVILVTILSILSLGVTYLARAKVFGPGLTGAKAGLIRAAANAPYALVVAFFLLLDVSKVGDDFYKAGGLGYGAALGLAGAALAGMPRKSEADSSSANALQATVMRLAVPALAALWVLMSFINLINVFADLAPVYDNFALTLSFAVRVLVVLIPLALLAFGLFRRSAVARTVALAGGGIVLGVMIIDWFSDWDLSGIGVESVHRPVFGLIAFVTLGALASSHVFRDAMHPVDDVKRYVSTAGFLLMAQAALVLAIVLSTILFLLADEGLSGGKAIGYIFTLLIIAALAAVAFMMVRTGKSGTRLLALAIIAGSMVVGIVAMILANSADLVSPMDPIYAFGLPIATLVVLLVPASMRAHFGSPLAGTGAPAAAAPLAPPTAAPLAPPTAAPLAPPTAAPVVPSAPVAEVPAPPVTPPAPPVTPPAPPVAPPAPVAVHARAAEAANPGTSAQELFDIASNVPELRAAVASNPSTYPDLLTWLGQLGDPAVDAALKARGV